MCGLRSGTINQLSAAATRAQCLTSDQPVGRRARKWTCTLWGCRLRLQTQRSSAKKRKIKPYCPPHHSERPGAIFSRGRKEGLLGDSESRTNEPDAESLPCFVFLFLLTHPEGKKRHKITKQHKVPVSSPRLDLALDDGAVRKCASGAAETKGCDVIRLKVTTSELLNLGKRV